MKKRKKPKGYKQLSQSERESLYKMKMEGKSLRHIGGVLGRSVSTISREVKRNSHEVLGEYLPDTAERKSIKRKEQNRKQRYIDKKEEVRSYVEARLEEEWSPEQIAGRMPEDLDCYLNYESIYKYIYSLEGRKKGLREHLRRQHSIRGTKGGRKAYRGKIPNRVDISSRPIHVEAKKVFGHWEGDSMMFLGHSQMLATQVERKSRFMVVLKPEDMTAKSRSSCIIDYFYKLPPRARRSITVDNGHEFSDHEKITKTIKTDIYFARPYAAYQRGTNEHHNGLLRWYLPRNTDINKLDSATLKHLVDKINNRPRKCLNFKKPMEVFYDEIKKAYRNSVTVALKS